jgi:hypothetical protein
MVEEYNDKRVDVTYTTGEWWGGVMLHVIPMSLLCPSKNDVTFKITIELVIDQK